MPAAEKMGDRILRPGKGTCYVPEAIAAPFKSRSCGRPDWAL